MNSSSPVFAHQSRLAKKLAKNFDQTFVLTADGEFGQPEPSPRAFRLESLCWKPNQTIKNSIKLCIKTFEIVLKYRPNYVFYHMTDVQAAIVSPIFHFLGVRQVLWYAHTSNSIWLKIAEKFVDKVVTSTPGSYPHYNDDIECVGQAVDLEQFTFTHRLASNCLKAVHVGRLDKSKNIEELILWAIDAINEKKIVSLTLIGEPTHENLDYWQLLQSRYVDLFRSESIIWLGAIAHNELPKRLQEYSIFVHAYRGSLDKAVLEATSLGLSVLTINTEFISQFGRWGEGELNLKNELDGYLKHFDLEIKEVNLNRLKNIQVFHSDHNWSKRIAKIILQKNSIKSSLR